MMERCTKTIYEPTRKEYVESVNYRVVQLLLRYRAIAEIKCNQLLSDVLGWKLCRSDADAYVGLIYDGNIELNEDEIELLAKYISQAFGYNAVNFLNTVKFDALYYEGSDDEKVNLRRQMVTISSITNEL